MENCFCKGYNVIKTKCYFLKDEDEDYCIIHNNKIYTCSICLSEINLQNDTYLFRRNIGYELSCKHIFHYKCIENWFKKHDSCPYCRTCVSDDPIIINRRQLELDIHGKRILDILTNPSYSVTSDINSSETT